MTQAAPLARAYPSAAYLVRDPFQSLVARHRFFQQSFRPWAPYPALSSLQQLIMVRRLSSSSWSRRTRL